jgi:hypothetical protein
MLYPLSYGRMSSNHLQLCGADDVSRGGGERI